MYIVFFIHTRATNLAFDLSVAIKAEHALKSAFCLLVKANPRLSDNEAWLIVVLFYWGFLILDSYYCFILPQLSLKTVKSQNNNAQLAVNSRRIHEPGWNAEILLILHMTKCLLCDYILGKPS